MVRPSTARLQGSEPAELTMLVVGDGPALGGPRQVLHGSGLPAELVRQALGGVGLQVSVDVAWNLRPALQALTGLLSTGRLPDFDVVVVVVPAAELLAAGRRLRRVPVRSWPPRETCPQIVLVLTSTRVDGAAAARAEASVHDLARAQAPWPVPTVVHALVAADGALLEPRAVAAAVTRRLGVRRPAQETTSDPSDTEAREVAVDLSLRALRGRTSHLRRAVTLAQNSFDVPYAQLNLVSRGTLRSLAYIGRSSDGLERSLSAEAVRQDGPLLISDTRAGDRFVDIPETRGPDAIRYYAGHPVRSRSGHHVGVLCVLDTAPRDICPGDDVLIRDLALLAEGELSALTGHL